jgi:thiol-disulfide isomerase/thioredoxin
MSSPDRPTSTRRARLALVIVVAFAASAVAFAIERSAHASRGASRGQVVAAAAAGLDPVASRRPAPELVRPRGFLNGPPFTLASLRGKVVLVDFWTFDCINCQHTIPYLRAWYERYRRAGLEIVGVHTPELAEERDPRNVAAAVRSLGVRWPVVLDPDYATWDAYGNQFWPAQYLLDKHGRIAELHIGEGAYDQLDAAIRALLTER